MKEAMIVIIAASIIATSMLAAIRHGRQVADLENAVTVLERQVAHRQTMLDDAHRYVEHLQRELICVESDMTAREWMWIMAEQFKNAGVKVKFH